MYIYSRLYTEAFYKTVTQGVPIKTIYYKKFLYFINGSVQISVKLSDFVWEYSCKISCKFHWNKWYGSTDKTLSLMFSSEHAVVHWIFTNNELYFAQPFINSSKDTIALSINSFHIINKTVFYLGSVSQFGHVSLLAFQHCTLYMIIHWHINLVHFLLLLNQNSRLINVHVKNVLLSSNSYNF